MLDKREVDGAAPSPATVFRVQSFEVKHRPFKPTMKGQYLLDLRAASDNESTAALQAAGRGLIPRRSTNLCWVSSEAERPFYMRRVEGSSPSPSTIIVSGWRCRPCDAELLSYLCGIGFYAFVAE